ncbi:ribonuclease H-like domain-containing protein [Rhizophagus clarus]|uniref:Ribonuclease H-like domain-containing protein n=1 Tax=Rhizophagus clarus TaxID=94130 RepID=A0A8H3R2T0_9GLOM|nr:ribonuclease H-like domain-containing protein [Rhizophagus clarus]GET01886.1 ribonuclease H-like domain-containing protein [Rhizophagus clarus]GET04945.1 ribonuclease H-like domain-containing protein [Rhizophagus clarus]
MVKSLCLGYDPPSANALSQDFLYEELAKIVVDQHLELKRTKNLTLGFDGWTSPLGQSLYAWTTAWDCTNSILRLEQILKNVLDETPEKLTYLLHPHYRGKGLRPTYWDGLQIKEELN